MEAVSACALCSAVPLGFLIYNLRVFGLSKHLQKYEGASQSR